MISKPVCVKFLQHLCKMSKYWGNMGVASCIWAWFMLVIAQLIEFGLFSLLPSLSPSGLRPVLVFPQHCMSSLMDTT